MTAVDVDALDAARAAATAGVWKLWGMDVMADQDGTSNVDTAVLVAHTCYRDENGKPRTFDAELICQMQRALPELLDEVRRGRALREQHDELRHRLKALVDEWDAMARNLHHIPVAEAYADVVIGLRAALAAGDPS